MFAPYDDALYAKWYDDESWGSRDPRIQRHLLRHRRWLPFSESRSQIDDLQFDADPTPAGRYGQIIRFVHDPDGIFWESDDFLTFFRRSNDILEECLDDPEFLIEELDLAGYRLEPPAGFREPGAFPPVVIEFDGVRLTWPGSERPSYYWSADSDAGRKDISEQSCYLREGAYTLLLDHGRIVFVDDGAEFEFGSFRAGDHIEVVGYKKILVNGQLRAESSGVESPE